MSPDAPGVRDDLAARVTHLEQLVERLESLVEGLQDLIHRQSLRHDRDIVDLRVRTVPAQIARDLSEDARRRGL
jgi:hypothetical protein